MEKYSSLEHTAIYMAFARYQAEVAIAGYQVDQILHQAVSPTVLEIQSCLGRVTNT